MQSRGFLDGKSASTPIDTDKPLLKDPDGEDVDVHTYMSLIGSLMYLTSSRSDIMFAVCACAHFQVTLKASHLHAIKRIFRLIFNAVSLKFLLFGFEQILDFLNASVIQYALTVNPTIYVSCIKQFWSSVSIKKTNDVVRLQALIDRKKVIITQDTIRQALHLDYARSVDCLPNEEIFAELARMGTAWNEFSSSMASAVICPATGRKFNFSKYIFDYLVRNVDSSSKFYMVGKGFSGVDTPLFEGMLVPQQAADDVANVVADDVDDDVADVDVKPTPPSPTPATTPQPPQELLPSTSQIAQALKITKLKERVRRLKKKNKRMHPNRGIIAEIDANEDVILEEVDAEKDVEVAEKDAEQAQIDQDEAYTRELEAELNKNINGDDVIEQVKRKEKEDNAVLRYQALERKPQTEAHAKKNMMVYLKNMVGFKMAFFKDANEDVILEEVDAEKDVEVAEKDAEVAKKDAEVAKKDDDKPEPAELKEVIEVVTTAKLMTEVVTVAATTITAAPSAARRRKG
nr:hypothetical protein [Tanacetum cinerariifolium]